MHQCKAERQRSTTGTTTGILKLLQSTAMLLTMVGMIFKLFPATAVRQTVTGIVRRSRDRQLRTRTWRMQLEALLVGSYALTMTGDNFKPLPPTTMLHTMFATC